MGTGDPRQRRGFQLQLDLAFEEKYGRLMATRTPAVEWKPVEGFQVGCSSHHYIQGFFYCFIYPSWCTMISINSTTMWFQRCFCFHRELWETRSNLTNWVAQPLTCPVLPTTIMLRAPPPRILPLSQPSDLGHYCNPAKDLVIANIFDGAVVGGNPSWLGWYAAMHWSPSQEFKNRGYEKLGRWV